MGYKVFLKCFIVCILCNLVVISYSYATTYGNLSITGSSIFTADVDIFDGTITVSTGSGFMFLTGANYTFNDTIIVTSTATMEAHGNGYVFNTHLNVGASSFFHLEGDNYQWGYGEVYYNINVSGEINILGNSNNLVTYLNGGSGSIVNILGNDNYIRHVNLQDGSNTVIGGNHNSFGFVGVGQNNQIRLKGTGNHMGGLYLYWETVDAEMEGDDHHIDYLFVRTNFPITGNNNTFDVFEVGAAGDHVITVSLDGDNHQLIRLRVESQSSLATPIFAGTGNDVFYGGVLIGYRGVVNISGNSNHFEDSTRMEEEGTFNLTGNYHIFNDDIIVTGSSTASIGDSSSNEYVIKGLLDVGDGSSITVKGLRHTFSGVKVGNTGTLTIGEAASSGYTFNGDMDIEVGGTLSVLGTDHLFADKINNAGISNIKGKFNAVTLSNTGTMVLDITGGDAVSVSNSSALTLSTEVSGISYDVGSLDQYVLAENRSEEFIRIGSLVTTGSGGSSVQVKAGGLLIESLEGDLTGLTLGLGSFAGIKGVSTVSTMGTFDNVEGAIISVSGNWIIESYKSNGGFTIIDDRNEARSTLTIKNVSESKDEKVGLLFDISSMLVGATESFEFLIVEGGGIDIKDEELDYKLYIGSTLLDEAASDIEFEIVDVARAGQSIIATVTKLSELHDNHDNHGAAALLEGLIDKLSGGVVEEKLNDLHDALVFYGEDTSKLDSLFPVSTEVYMMDIHGVSSMLMDSMSSIVKDLGNKQKRNTTGEQERESGFQLFANPMYIYSSLSDEKLTVGYSGYTGLLQVGMTWDSYGVIEGMKVGVVGSAAGGYGYLESNDSMRDYESRRMILSGQGGIYMESEYVDVILSLGYTYNKYKTERTVELLNIPEEDNVKLSNKSIISIAKPSVQEIIFGIDVSREMEGLFEGIIVPALYYKGGVVMFDSYSEDGSSGDLYLDELESVFISDIGAKVETVNQFLENMMLSLSVGVGYRYYDMGDVSYTFIEGKDIEDRDFLPSNNYVGAYVSPGVTVIIEAHHNLLIEVSYLGDISFAGTANHGAMLNLRYTL